MASSVPEQSQQQRVQGQKRPRSSSDVLSFRVAGRVERLSQADLDRFPGSTLHEAVTKSGQGGGSAHITIPDEAPHKELAHMVLQLFRGAELGDALLAAMRLSPQAFKQLSLTDIQEAIDYWGLPKSFLESNLKSLILAIDRPSASSLELASPQVVMSLRKLSLAASAHYTAHNVLLALQNPPRYTLLHGKTYFALLLRNVTGVDPLLLPLCFRLEPWEEDSSPETDVPMTNQIKFLTDVHTVQSLPATATDKPQILCMGNVFGSRSGFNEEKLVSEGMATSKHLYPCVSPMLFPGFCEALKQELSSSGLHVSWHSADVVMSLEVLLEDWHCSGFMCVLGVIEGCVDACWLQVNVMDWESGGLL